MAFPLPRSHPTRCGFHTNAVLLGGLLLAICGSATSALASSSGDKGAEVYCFMRGNGNAHEVSWTAAYALIKRQSSGLFKTSPEHAAVMITEAVVEDPGAYPDCGQYIGDLYIRRGTSRRSSSSRSSSSQSEYHQDGDTADSGMTRSERYGY